MKLMTMAAAALACSVGCISSALADDVPALLEAHKCYVCHGDSEARAGPAFVDVAQRYHGQSKAVASVAALIRSGSSSGGPWHMPPHPEVSASEADAMARYILALKPAR
jgi:cytochrome c551/c552